MESNGKSASSAIPRIDFDIIPPIPIGVMKVGKVEHLP